MLSGHQSLRDPRAFIPPKENGGQLLAHNIEGLTQFDPSRIGAEEYEEYLSFVESVWNHSSKGLIPSRFSLDAALKILHDSNYSLARAKFWIQFPLLYKIEKERDAEDVMLNKRRQVSDLPDEDLNDYLQEYYEGLRKNKSNAEVRWIQAVKQLASEENKSGKDVRKLQHEAVLSRFEIPYELKALIDLENRLSGDIDLALAAGQKDTSDVLKLYSKCVEQKFKPSNFERLESEALYIKSLQYECLQSADKTTQYAELKALTDKLSAFKTLPEFKPVQERFNQATQLKNSIGPFLRTQKTRGSNTEEKLDVSKGLEILKQIDTIKVVIDGVDKFKEKLDSVVELLKEVEAFLAGPAENKTAEAVAQITEKILSSGVETDQILKLNSLRDSLELIAQAERNLSNPVDAENSLLLLKQVRDRGFTTRRLTELLSSFEDLVKWKDQFNKFIRTPTQFSITQFLNGQLPPLFDYSQFLEVYKVPSKVPIGQDESTLLLKSKSKFDSIITSLPEAKTLSEKITKAKEIFQGRLSDQNIQDFLINLKKELEFTVEALSILNTMGSKAQLEGLTKLLEDVIYKAKQPSILQMESLVKKEEFAHLEVYSILSTELVNLKHVVAQALSAVQSEDYKKIKELEHKFAGLGVCSEIHAQLKNSLAYFEWKNDVTHILEIRSSSDPKIEQTAILIEQDLESLEVLSVPEIINWYISKKESLAFLYKHSLNLPNFIKYEKLSRLAQEERNFDPTKDKELRKKLRQLKDDVDTRDSQKQSTNKLELLLPAQLAHLGKLLPFGIRTPFSLDIQKKLTRVIELERDTPAVTTLDHIKDLLLLFAQLGLWTPFSARLSMLKTWYSRTEEVAEKVIARVTRQRVQLISELFNKMISSPEEFEPKVFTDTFEIVIRRKERDEALSLRPRREKKKNQLYIGKNLETKPLKAREMIEEVAFNDFMDSKATFCICNRVAYFKMIQCDFCGKWYHVDCLKFNKSSLNKIKKFECPVCSLTQNNEFIRSLEIHKSERTSFEEYTQLFQEIQNLGKFIILGNNELDILEYFKRFETIQCLANPLVKEIDGYIEKSHENGFTADPVKRRVEVIVSELKEHLMHLLGLPFYTELIQKIALEIRKFNLIDRVYQLKDKKRVEYSDLQFIDAMKVEQELKSDFLRNGVSHCEAVLENLNKIEQAQKKRVPYAEYKKIFDKYAKNIRYTNLIEEKSRALEDWPKESEIIRLRLLDPKGQTYKYYKDTLAELSKHPFSSEIEDSLRERVNTLDTWKNDVRRAKESPPSVQTLIDLKAKVEGILSMDPDLDWLRASVQIAQNN
jgi:hypothetical protein